MHSLEIRKKSYFKCCCFLKWPRNFNFLLHRIIDTPSPSKIKKVLTYSYKHISFGIFYWYWSLVSMSIMQDCRILTKVGCFFVFFSKASRASSSLSGYTCCELWKYRVYLSAEEVGEEPKITHNKYINLWNRSMKYPCCSWTSHKSEEHIIFFEIQNHTIT